MRSAKIWVNNVPAARLVEKENKQGYLIEYLKDYQGAPISLTLPISQNLYEFEAFPSFFEGVLPEGPQLEALLKKAKLDREDYFGQLVRVGLDLVGNVTVKEEYHEE